MTDGDRPADRDRDEDLRERLAELEDVLSRLRSDLRDEVGTRSRVPRPPSPAELLRFTERYTLPTVIALLEAAIRSLELLRATLRLADPERRGVVDGPDTDGSSDRLADVRDGTAAGVRRSLSELRTALSAADLPREATSRELLEDARTLSAEIDELLAEFSTDPGTKNGIDPDDSTDRRSDPGEGVSIDVRDPDSSPNSDSESTSTADEDSDSASTVNEDSDPEASSSGTADDASPPAVDVDAELESIKDELADDDTNGDEKAGEEPDEAEPDGEETGSNEASGNEPGGDEASANGSDADDTTAGDDPAA
ncbi:hypothetical protein ACFQAS_06485 [Halopenitus salinus]|uniref:Uncharacterized protein n=1 Tax=Halopenitus salinus TaxID=1198295 RepID=A0ABD5UV55_9EURY